MERQVGMLQVRPRGPYRQLGPGVVLPVISNAARPLLPVAEAMEQAAASAGGFLQGLYNGLTGSVSTEQRRLLAQKMAQSSVLTAIFPPIFAAGAVVGIVEDVVEGIKGAVELITNFSEVVSNTIELINTLLSPGGTAFARQLGEAIGEEYGNKIVSLLQGNIIEFTFGLGRLIGPTIVYVVLAFLGIPQALAAALVARLLAVLRPLLQRLPGMMRLLERIAARLGRRRRRQHDHEPPPDPLRVRTPRVRITLREILDWEGQGGHMLQKHGPQHTRETLWQRILGERDMPPPRDLPGGQRTHDFRIWKGERDRTSSRWLDNDTLSDILTDVINSHIDEIDEVTRRGGRYRLEQYPVNRVVGEGWARVGGAANDAVVIDWRDNLRHVTLDIDPRQGGGWYVSTAYPDVAP